MDWFKKMLHAIMLRRFSCVWLCETLWTVACQAPLSLGFSKPEYWSGLPCSPPGYIPNPGIEPASPVLAGGFFTTESSGKPKKIVKRNENQGLVTSLLLVVAQTVNNLPAMWETWVWFLHLEDSLEKGTITYSSILAWRIPRTEEPGRIRSKGLQQVGHHWATFTFTFTYCWWSMIK